MPELFVSGTSHCLTFLSCTTAMWWTPQPLCSAYFLSFFFLPSRNVKCVLPVREWATLPVWAALPSLANKRSGFCNKSLGLRCFLCEHSDGGQETLPIWPIYDTCSCSWRRPPWRRPQSAPQREELILHFFTFDSSRYSRIIWTVSAHISAQ